MQAGKGVDVVTSPLGGLKLDALFSAKPTSVATSKLLNPTSYHANKDSVLDLSDLEAFYYDLFDRDVSKDSKFRHVKASAAELEALKYAPEEADLVSLELKSVETMIANKAANNKTPYIILAILTLIIMVVAGVIFYHIYTKSGETKVLEARPIHEVKGKEGIYTWLDKIKEKEFEYPATTIRLRAKLGDKSLIDTYTSVIISGLDEYMFYCLNQILKKHDIKFTYYKNGDILNFIIFLDSINREQILTSLQYYNIGYKVQ